MLSTWDDDPWVRRGLLDLAAARRWPRPAERPTGPLAFAGEHTAGEFYALMEGAIRSGRRAARSLLRGVTSR